MARMAASAATRASHLSDPQGKLSVDADTLRRTRTNLSARRKGDLMSSSATTLLETHTATIDNHHTPERMGVHRAVPMV